MARSLSRFCGWLGAAALVLSPVRAAAQAAPPASQPPASAAPAPADDDSRSLFAPTWNTFQLASRASSVEGDPARWQRYQDLRDGLLFTNVRALRETERWNVNLTADNVGYRDQRYSGRYERVGLFQIKGMWDQIPQFYSVDTATAFTSTGDGVLTLPDEAQRAANHNAYLSISPKFDLRERRDIGAFSVKATPTTKLDVTGAFRTTAHSGELPWGASFGFNNDNEVPLPYESRTNDMDLGLEWTNKKAMIRAAYTGSWFENQASTLTWDNPLVLNDTATAPGHGRTALWPTNSFQSVSTAGYAKFGRRTQLTGALAFGWANNDEPLLPFTINSALPQLVLPRATTVASADTLSTNLSLVSRPQDDWGFSARFRHYGYNNGTPETAIPSFINYDTSVKVSSTGGPHAYAHARNTLDADATWNGFRPLAVTVGYSNNHNTYDFRIFESSDENTFHLKADSAGYGWMNFRARWEYSDRTGSGLDEAALVQVGEQPALRHYDVANRTRNRFVGQIDIVPTEALTFSVSGGTGTDEYPDSYFGLREAGFHNVTASADYSAANGMGVGASYDYERYTGLQRSRSASPGGQDLDPNRDWTTDSKERVQYFSLYLNPPRFGATEMRVAYEYANARGTILYNVGPALPRPSQLPETFNRLQDFRFDVRHRVNRRMAATFAYTYEPSKIFDFALDPGVINSIVQPSSLVLGYTYRPYTAHTAVFGIQYFW